MSQAITNVHAGAELGDTSEFLITSGTVAVDATSHSGNYAFKITGSSSYASLSAYPTVAIGDYQAVRLYFRCAALPGTKQYILQSTAGGFGIYLGTGGALTLNGNGGETSSFGTVSVGNWYRLDLCILRGSPYTAYARLENGSPVSTTHNNDLTAFLLYGIGSSDDAFYDDILAYDTNSSSGPAWAPDGYSVIYRPTADSSTDDAWQPATSYSTVNDDSDSTESYSDGANAQAWEITPDTISSINSFMLWARLHDVGGYGGPAYIDSYNRDSSESESSSDLTSSLATSYGNFSFQPTSYVPDGQTELDAYEAGCSSGHASKDLYCSEFWMSLDISVGAATEIKTINDLAYASINTVNDLAMASVATKNDLT